MSGAGEDRSNVGSAESSFVMVSFCQRQDFRPRGRLECPFVPPFRPPISPKLCPFELPAREVHDPHDFLSLSYSFLSILTWRAAVWLQPDDTSFGSQLGMLNLQRSRLRTSFRARRCQGRSGRYSSTRTSRKHITMHMERSSVNMSMPRIRLSPQSTPSSLSFQETCWNSSGVLRICAFDFLFYFGNCPHDLGGSSFVVDCVPSIIFSLRCFY